MGGLVRRRTREAADGQSPGSGVLPSLMTGASPPPCPLCGSRSPEHYLLSAEQRVYFRCATCELVYLHPGQRPGRAEERARYDRHHNDAADPGYVRFLRELADPMMERLARGTRGIDFGSGPAPVLASLFTEAGFPCAAYDPFFAPDEALLGARYDFVACSEVIEHVHDPASVFALFEQLLGSPGLLGVMTRFHDPAVPFEAWWYRRDITHVCFYTQSTMRWIAERNGWMLVFPREHVALFTT